MASRWADRLERFLPGPRERVLSRARQDDILLLSAGLGFYRLVSIAPLGILVLWVSSLVLGEQRIHELANALARIGPNELGLDRILKRVGDQGTGAGVAAIVTGLWPPSAYGARAVPGLQPAVLRQEVGDAGPAGPGPASPGAVPGVRPGEPGHLVRRLERAR